MFLLPTKRWNISRAVLLFAGCMTILSLVLGLYVSPLFFILTGLVGFMQIIFTVTGFCPFAILLSSLGVPCDSNK